MSDLKYWVVGISLMAFFFGCNSELDIQVFEPEEMSEILSGYEKGIAPENLRSLLENKDIQLIDVREAVLYSKGHLPGAMNVPVARFSDKEVIGSFIDLDKELVLYGENEAETVGPWCMLIANGIKEVSTSLAGYTVLRSDSLSASWGDQRSKYDYASEYQQALADLEEKKEADKPEPVIRYKTEVQPKKKVQLTPRKKSPSAQEEGC